MSGSALRDGRNWIDGAASDALGGDWILSAAPGTGEPLARLARSGSSDVDRAVASARAAQVAWARVDPNEKARLLWEIGNRILARAEALAALEAVDVGKPIANARLIDVPRTADTFFYFSGWATKLHGETIPVRGSFLHYTVKEPIGVVAAIIPWNFPLLLAARKIAPALATGNAVVLKPPEEASLSCLLLAEICSEAGLPPGLVNVVTGLGEEAGAALVAHSDVGKVAFTGGTDTGRLVMRNAATGLKRLQLELGGKSPNVVFADADLDQAATAAVSAAFYNQGELCTSGSRLLVERGVYDEVLARVVAGTERLRLGDPLDARTTLGPLISAPHRARVLDYIASGHAEGARRMTGGDPRDPGYFVTPTVFADVRPEMRIHQEEIFGPVLSVLPFDDAADAVRLANATEFGLAAGIWTRDIGRAHTVAGQIRAGTVWINTYNRFDAASPYGGIGASGFGRENGRAVLDELTTTKTVWVALS
jgi:acyl-CoA reductase-like NAD-dependent aldehyde dehydrogenase